MHVVNMLDNVSYHIIFIIIMTSKPNFDYLILPTKIYFIPFVSDYILRLC